jgi:hypothetical protein
MEEVIATIYGQVSRDENVNGNAHVPVDAEPLTAGE